MKWCNFNLSGKVTIKIDSRDIKEVKKTHWYIIIGSSGKIKIIGHVNKRSVTLGNFLLKPKAGLQVFFKNLDRLDFRRSNLLACTLKERQRMLGKKSGNNYTSKYRGVSFVRQTEKWRASIEVNGVSKYVGVFDSEEEAALSWNKSAREFFGPHSFQNNCDM